MSARPTRWAPSYRRWRKCRPGRHKGREAAACTGKCRPGRQDGRQAIARRRKCRPGRYKGREAAACTGKCRPGRQDGRQAIARRRKCRPGRHKGREAAACAARCRRARQNGLEGALQAANVVLADKIDVKLRLRGENVGDTSTSTILKYKHDAPSGAAGGVFAAERASAGGAPAAFRVHLKDWNAETRTMAREHAKAAPAAERTAGRSRAPQGSASVAYPRRGGAARTC